MFVLKSFADFFFLDIGQKPCWCIFLQRVIISLNPAQVTSKHKHRCCPCQKWADFVYSLILD